MFENLTSVLNIRKNYNLVPDCTGLYKWWFKSDDVNILLSKNGRSLIDMNNVEKKSINGSTYYALYIGQAKKETIRSRMKWHIGQAHKKSAVKHGTLSTLRQTISALLEKNMSESECDVNNIMDHAFVEFFEIDKSNDSEINSKEIQCINSHLLPLNIQHNNVANPELKRVIKQLRKSYKK